MGITFIFSPAFRHEGAGQEQEEGDESVTEERTPVFPLPWPWQ